MQENTFKGILIRFGYSIAWCFVLGILLGLTYNFSNAVIQAEIKDILSENSAPKSFNLISVLSVFSLGFIVTIFGRTKNEISTIRNFVGYKPAEVALALAAVFYGLIVGFSLAVWELPLVAVGFYAFCVTAGILLVLLWLSFQGNGIKSELKVRGFSAVLVLSSLAVTWYEYFR
ncbi:MAG: hypothetical protein RI556_01235 [Hydrogenovibrio sp.]|uniref:hypothetical protein n=1 Tax=Hydrogenovibrio sp. TaxID=2065821 RepID=UPI0028706FC9|nr:hypothetical protein [Hydrogenovibrio sp.]MDR9497770.1 hypothetical protein [Hydrogenovibrio sp.]